MGETEQEVKTVATQGIRLIFSLSTDFINQIDRGIRNVYNWRKTHNYNNAHGLRFNNKEQFILKSKLDNRNADFAKQTIRNNDKQMKLFLRLCKNRGVDVYLERCPTNIDVLINKNNNNEFLTSKENDYIKAFCNINEDGKVTDCFKDAGVVMFKSSDLNIVNDIVKDTEQQCMNLRRRKLRAQEKADNIIKKINKAPTITQEK